MIEFRNYISFGTKEEFDKKVPVPLIYKGCRFLEVPRSYPATFKSAPDEDFHFIGSWIPCDEKEMFQTMRDLRDRISSMLEEETEEKETILYSVNCCNDGVPITWGIFSTKEKAEKARAEYKKQYPGFGFGVDAYVLDSIS